VSGGVTRWVGCARDATFRNVPAAARILRGDKQLAE
jgi:hypothetical protein